MQYSGVFFDELTHFSESQFTYLLSRLRSDADVKSYCMASCNPDADSWVLKWVDWWLDDDGYPDPEKKGRVRYYIIVDEVPFFADSEEEMREKYGDKLTIWNPKTEKHIELPIKTFTFIGGTIFDNQILIDKNPNYLAELNSLPEVERARLLHGNWYARAQGSNYFQREWLNKVDSIPINDVCVRGWDKASQEPSTKERRPDYTASIKLYKNRDGFYTIVGDFIPENVDETGEIYGLMRKRAGARDTIIAKQGLHDGVDCRIVLPVDPAAAGKAEYLAASQKLIAQGLRPAKDPSTSNASKLTKFTPFAVACENGLVSICESSFRNKASLNAFYKQCESFDGERSTRERKDDYPDCVATAFNYLNSTKIHKCVPRSQVRKSSEASSVLQNSQGMLERYNSQDRPDIKDLQQ